LFSVSFPFPFRFSVLNGRDPVESCGQLAKSWAGHFPFSFPIPFLFVWWWFLWVVESLVWVWEAVVLGGNP
jgi:hypothetical protein